MVYFQEATWVIVSLTILTSRIVCEDTGPFPQFIENVPNITVTVGRDALMHCTVEKLKEFKVAWVQVDTQTILTIHKQVITRNPRISLLHNDHRTWHLQLKNVRESDRGWYMCQVNTDPMRYQQGYVDVVVPPDIIDKESSGDLTIREGQDVTLTCRAKGHPQPEVIWRREDNKEIVLDSTGLGGVNTVMVGMSGAKGPLDIIVSDPRRGAVKQVEGESLEMRKVSRLQMGVYLCIASNGIPPSISKRTHLRVQFPPVAWVPQQLEGAYIGQELTIECHTEAFPRSINYWTNPQRDMIVHGDEYEPLLVDTEYKSYMKLKIISVGPHDFGTFKCIAKNSLGETDGGIKIYEIPPPESFSNSVSGQEETDGESGDLPNSIEHTHKNGGNKYNNYRPPGKINDINDRHRNSKTHDNKGQGQGQRSTAHHGSRPGYGSQMDHVSGSAGFKSRLGGLWLIISILGASIALQLVALGPH